MATNIIPFNSDSKLPAYIQKAMGKVSLSDLTEGVGGGFPYLSIKGKTWTVVRSKDDKKILRNPKDPDEPATNVALVIIKASKHLGRIYYENGYEEGSAARPDCFSNDGVKPDPAVESPQCKTCAACKHAVFIQGKGPECRQSRRLAVAPPNAINDPMLLRVPAASLKNLANFGSMVSKRGVPYHLVITKIKFDAEEATPRLVFEPIGFVSEELVPEIEKVQESELVEQILGLSGGAEGVDPVPVEEENDDTPTVEEIAEAIEDKPKAKAKPEPVEEEAEKEPEEKPKPKDKPKAKAKPEPEASDIDDGLSSMLAAFDD